VERDRQRNDATGTFAVSDTGIGSRSSLRVVRALHQVKSTARRVSRHRLGLALVSSGSLLGGDACHERRRSGVHLLRNRLDPPTRSTGRRDAHLHAWLVVEIPQRRSTPRVGCCDRAGFTVLEASTVEQACLVPRAQKRRRDVSGHPTCPAPRVSGLPRNSSPAGLSADPSRLPLRVVRRPTVTRSRGTRPAPIGF